MKGTDPRCPPCVCRLAASVSVFGFTCKWRTCIIQYLMTRSYPDRRRCAGLALAVFAAAGLLTLAGPVSAARTDVVILHNGDHITGEIKKLDSGKLEYKTDDMDKIYIEWERIDHVTSVNRFEVIDVEGIRRWGSIGRTERPGEVVIIGAVARDTVDIVSIVRLIQIKESFWQRLKGSISAGFSYTRATETAEATLGGDTNYRGETYAGKLSYSGYTTDQAERRTSRYNAAFNIDRFLRRRWTVGGAVSAEHNEELGLDLRTSLTAVGSRYLVETNRTVLRLSLGLAATHESYIAADSTSYNLELPLEVYYSRFTFHDPESNIGLTVAVYPSLTTQGRYRSSIKVDLDHEVYKDLYFVIGLYYDYDSKPPGDAAKDDYRLSTSLKWTFG